MKDIDICFVSFGYVFAEDSVYGIRRKFVARALSYRNIHGFSIVRNELIARTLCICLQTDDFGDHIWIDIFFFTASE